MDRQSALLKRIFGHDAFRGGQEEAVNTLLSGRDALCVMPTGAGKSMCYQIPALMMEGITLVISPLISLMKDQVAALVAADVAGAYINSSLTRAQSEKALQRAKEGRYKIIYVAPERLLTDAFIAFATKANISMVAVDEAHCVSQWGQDFRPSYLDIPTFIKYLPRRPIVSAFTATATLAVRDDIVSLLELKEPQIIQTGFDRENLFFDVKQPKDKFAYLLDFVKERQAQCGIIYCLTRKTVEEVSGRLKLNHINATRYHAGLDDDERRQNQDDFIYDRCNVMVATNAFGMGIDKSNVSYVVHYNMPKNIESYYQEAGRAGRDGEKAQCLLLYSDQDVATCRYLIELSKENENIAPEVLPAILQKEYHRLDKMRGYATTNTCLRRYILQYFGQDADQNCGNCGNCQTEYELSDVTPQALAMLSIIKELSDKRQYFGKKMILDIAHGSKSSKLAQHGLNRLKTFGSLSGESMPKLEAIMRHLIAEEYIQSAIEAQYPIVKLNAKASDVISAGVPIHMKLLKSSDAAPLMAQSTDAAALLFEKLRALRAELAHEAKVPAYIIFTDAALRDMVLKRPQTLSAFQMVSGVGMHKTEKYGLRFIQAIRDFTLAN